jgi:hypothetical protein
MLALVELRRQPAGHSDVLGRSLHEVVGQAGDLVGRRIAVELGPARIMVQDHAEHQVARLGRRKPIVTEAAGELMRQGRVLVHHDRQTRLAGRRGLNDHV